MTACGYMAWFINGCSIASEERAQLMCGWPIEAFTYYSYFQPTKLKTHYIAPQFFIFRQTIQISFIEMRTYFSFGLILQDIPNSITPQTTLRLLPIPVGLLVLPCTHQCRRSPLTPSPFFFPVLDRGTGKVYLFPWQACATTACPECAP